MSPQSINQTLIDDNKPPFEIRQLLLECDQINNKALRFFSGPEPVGLAAGYSSGGVLEALAMSSMTRIIVIHFPPPPKGNNIEEMPLSVGKEKLQAVLGNPVGLRYGFDIGPLVMGLYDHGIRIANAIDIQSAFLEVARNREPLACIKACLGEATTSVRVFEKNVEDSFEDPVYSKENAIHFAMRAWIAQFLPSYENGASMFDKVPKVDITKWTNERLKTVGKVIKDSLTLHIKKPTETEHTFEHRGSGNAQAVAQSYDHRFRAKKTLHVEAQTAQGTTIHVSATPSAIQGAVANIRAADGTDVLQNQKTMLKITSVGREGATNAEAKRAALILNVLQGKHDLFENPWFSAVWGNLSDTAHQWPEHWLEEMKGKTELTATEDTGLNPSQLKAVNRILSHSDSHRITLVQGPPGTGKTSVIAQYVKIATQGGLSGIWLVAQSNVAVKNIAEKLAAIGFKDWKLLVSDDFHEYWHEHIYERVRPNIIKSTEFQRLPSSRMRGVKVVLCTLSMLSNRWVPLKFTQHVALRTLVVDEASQIQIGDYIHAFSSFLPSLRKVCFIGDDKQLPPFGQEDIQDLQSVFEVEHLRKEATFLDTQYRMPPQIGRIISEAVYDGNLLSNPKHPIADNIIACTFIDVAAGQEQKLQSGSSYNEKERDEVIKLATFLQKQQASYKIITPYEGQRSGIENQMKLLSDTPIDDEESQTLDWKDKCFNVDSFQGNEEDYIIISLVRTQQIGFLKNLRRTNVMLTRCKRGMFIICNKKFVGSAAKDTLVGVMAAACGAEGWATVRDIELKGLNRERAK